MSWLSTAVKGAGKALGLGSLGGVANAIGIAGTLASLLSRHRGGTPAYTQEPGMTYAASILPDILERMRLGVIQPGGTEAFQARSQYDQLVRELMGRLGGNILGSQAITGAGLQGVGALAGLLQQVRAQQLSEQYSRAFQLANLLGGLATSQAGFLQQADYLARQEAEARRQSQFQALQTLGGILGTLSAKKPQSKMTSFQTPMSNPYTGAFQNFLSNYSYKLLPNFGFRP